ncbi:MAG: EAL domain-containing protein [Candidatus Dormibacteraeota bacterium]|uniref:EAL domain-containing protein n=1 Tax=Candidatus Amunia macphersoniae TaxID=3127014 RepID=A0A934NIY9_9BACT|nr:EAL domain-containing protein [Candidatus Dormibacteraeota bacterium]
MPTTVPAPFEALFAGSSKGDRAAVDQLCRLVDASSDVLLEVDGKRVPLPSSLRTLLQRAVDHLRRGDDIRRSFGRAPARTLLQPVVHLATGRIAGYEALSDISTRDVQSADSWFRDAAVLGLGEEFELVLLSLALEELTTLPEHAYLSVNVSPHTVLSPHLPGLLDDVSGERLVLELTEHTPVDDYAALNTALGRLRRQGIRLAVDDAGAGFSSLNHILLIRPEIVKLDVSLIRDIDSDVARRSLVGGLCHFTAEIGADCVAEGVETDAQARTLSELGVAYGQGWHLGPPRQRRTRRAAAGVKGPLPEPR